MDDNFFKKWDDAADVESVSDIVYAALSDENIRNAINLLRGPREAEWQEVKKPILTLPKPRTKFELNS